MEKSGDRETINPGGGGQKTRSSIILVLSYIELKTRSEMLATRMEIK